MMFGFIRKAFKRLTGKDETLGEEVQAEETLPREDMHDQPPVPPSQEEESEESPKEEEMLGEASPPTTQSEMGGTRDTPREKPLETHTGKAEREEKKEEGKEEGEDHARERASSHTPPDQTGEILSERKGGMADPRESSITPHTSSPVAQPPQHEETRRASSPRQTRPSAQHASSIPPIHETPPAGEEHALTLSSPLTPPREESTDASSISGEEESSLPLEESEMGEETLISGESETPPEEEKATLFGRLMQAVTTRTLSEDAFERLYEPMAYALLEANVAFEIVERLREALSERLVGKRLNRRHARSEIEHALREVVEESLHEPEADLLTLARKAKEAGRPFIILFLGPNGAGKTTTIAKLAYQFKQHGLRPVIAAADTFRAAALEQLREHAERLGVRVIMHDYGADPAAVAFDARKHAEAGHADVVLVDTAGRLQTNENLLREIEKVKRVVRPDVTLLVVESTAGSDAVEQARVFDERIGIDGFILTKTDADQLGGTLLSVSALTGKPIFLLGTGQAYEDLIPFRKDALISLLLGED